MYAYKQFDLRMPEIYIGKDCPRDLKIKSRAMFKFGMQY